MNPMVSHLSGVYRELGMPMIFTKFDEDTRNYLLEHSGSLSNATVFADEFHEKGHFAIKGWKEIEESL